MWYIFTLTRHIQELKRESLKRLERLTETLHLGVTVVTQVHSLSEPTDLYSQNGHALFFESRTKKK